MPRNAIIAFKKCGIYPHNPDFFTEPDFIAAQTIHEDQGQTEETFVHTMGTDSQKSILEPAEFEAGVVTVFKGREQASAVIVSKNVQSILVPAPIYNLLQLQQSGAYIGFYVCRI